MDGMDGEVRVYYDDTQSVSLKVGVVQVDDDDKFLTLRTQSGVIKIPVHRIVRIELGGGVRNAF